MLCTTIALKSDKKAFTLIELIIVLFIIGIASALVGGTLYRNIDDLHLKTAAKEMAASLRYTRSKAIAEKKIYSFATDINGYGLYANLSSKDQDAGLEKPVYFLQKEFPEGVYIEKSEYEDIRIDFFPEGDCTGGEILLKNLKSSSYSILIDKIHGRVKINRQ
ncbi:MAG: prepilin-type N-terminal cleavage/methylation domain-containing protein [Proteobacteria bacterium]|nr:prepilin-type N-terminal cleavage/methylation domain-containing protein [Pseudomonadota bacterium]